MSLAACDERCAKLRTSEATTANPSARFAGARGLDRSIERQQIGLPGDFVDNPDDVGDFARRFLDARHGINRFRRYLTAAVGDFAGIVRRLIGLLCVLCILSHGRRYFLH